jgi:IS1 family transposase
MGTGGGWESRRHREAVLFGRDRETCRRTGCLSRAECLGLCHGHYAAYKVLVRGDHAAKAPRRPRGRGL